MTLVCQRCGSGFSDYQTIDGRRRHLKSRRLCLRCRPFRPRHGPTFYGPRPKRFLTCARCGAEFLAKLVINGRLRSLYRRKFCLICSPFGSHNTSQNPVGADPDGAARRRKNRLQSWLRYVRKRRRERKRRLVELRGGRCEDCGYDATVAALEFHHRDSRTKEFGLGNFNGSWDRVVREAAKCDLLCANCHRRRHVSMWRTSASSTRKKMRAISLMGGACSGCRSEVPSAAFEFHHWDPREKEFGISRDGMRRPWEAIVAELSKCVMVCANCHREVHAGLRHIEGILRPVIVGEQSAA